ncbi:siderophore-interacting protein [Rhodococcus sp. NPDC003348]
MLQVVHTTQVEPRLVRLHLAGPQLGAFTDDAGRHPAVVSTGFDDVAILFFPQPGTERIALPEVAGDGGFVMPVNPDVIYREYTVRRLDSTGLVVDVILHDVGVATDWARRAGPGTPIGVVGPRVSRALPRTERILAVDDATALPALTRLAETLPRDAEGELVLVDGGPGLDLPIPAPAGVTVTRTAGADATYRALSELDLQPARTYAWLAGEAALVTSLRRHLVGERDFPKDHVQFTGYWRA